MRISGASKVILIAVVISAGFLLAFSQVNKGLYWDEAVYLGLAEGLYSGEGYEIRADSVFEGPGYFTNTEIVKESYRPPLFPAIIAGMWSIFGKSEDAARYLSIIFAVGSVVMVYFFGKELFSRKIGVVAAFIVASTPLFLFFSEKILTESVFVFVFTGFLLFYYRGLKGSSTYFYASGIFLLLAFFTRYFGAIGLLIYILVPALTQRRLYLDKNYILGAVIPLVLLLIIYNLGTLPTLEEAIKTQALAYNTIYNVQPWNFFISNWLPIFGVFGILALPAAYSLAKNKLGDSQKFLILSVILPLLVLSLGDRKEERYILSFLSVYAVLFSYGIWSVGKSINKIVPIIIAAMIVISLPSAYNLILGGADRASSVVDAGEFLKGKVDETSHIMTNNMPVIAYSSGARTINFPENENGFHESLSKYNVSYVVLDSYEETYPRYAVDNGVPGAITETLNLEAEFKEDGITVWVYSVGR